MKALFLTALLCAPVALSPAANAAFQSEEVRAKVEAGRVLLEDGRAEDAQVLLEEALELDGGHLRTRVWLIRSWMAQGRVNDSLDAIDEIAANGQEGPDLSYLYGMAFWSKARKNIAENADMGTVGMSFEDAVTFLSEATAADAKRFRDAHYALADSAYMSQRNELASEACERAIDHYPDDPQPRFLSGQVALSLFRVKNAEEALKDEADAQWQRAEAAFREAAKLVGTPKDDGERAFLAQVLVQLGNTLIWKQKTDEARKVYADALGWDPTAVDFSNLQSYFDGAGFRECLATGHEKFVRRHGRKTEADATLLWWLGWANMSEGDNAAAEKAYLACVEKWPAFSNSWFYAGIARYYQGDYEGSLEALLKHWDTDPAEFVKTVGYDRITYIGVLGYLVGWCAERKRNVEAAQVSEAMAGVNPENPIYWNNVGLFWRDAGETLARSSKEPPVRKQAYEYWEKSYNAYSQALELSPDDPSLLNDGAVLLHYYLQREYPLAKEMYEKAVLKAELALREGKLPQSLQELYTTAYRDARNNLALLEEKMKGGQVRGAAHESER